MPLATLPFTYADLVCELDCDPFMAETTSDLQNLIQDVLHVLKELPGTNPDDPEAGVGVEMYLNGTVGAFNALSGTIEQQLKRDERITDCSCTVATNPDGTFRLKVGISVDGTVIPLEYGWQNGQFTNLSGGQ